MQTIKRPKLNVSDVLWVWCVHVSNTEFRSVHPLQRGSLGRLENKYLGYVLYIFFHYDSSKP